MNAKRLAKLLISAFYLPFARRDRLTILYYHAVPADQKVGFERQMATLSRSATIVAPDHAGPVTARSVAITFDDAFRSVAQHALPALAENGISATVFVPTGHMGDHPRWAMESAGDQAEIVMSAAEIGLLPPDIIAIGSHAVSHPRLSPLDEASIREEVTRSKAILETIIGKPVTQLAFPYGDHDDRVVRICTEAGYTRVYTVAPQPIDPTDQDIKRGRTSVSPDDHPFEFYLKLRVAYGWMPMASALKRRLRSRHVPV